jgi:hypothetical protein
MLITIARFGAVKIHEDWRQLPRLSQLKYQRRIVFVIVKLEPKSQKEVLCPLGADTGTRTHAHHSYLFMFRIAQRCK